MFLYAFYRKYRWLLRIIALFFMGLIVAFVIALFQVKPESLRNDILSVLRDSTNMPVEIDGNISWHFSLHPEIELGEVHIPNADWAKNKNLFTAKKINVRLDLLSLFRHSPVIRHITVIDAKVFVEKNADGETSVVLNNLQTSENEPDTENNEIAKYPVAEFPFWGLDIENISVNLYGDKYELSSFGISNYMRNSNREFSGFVKPSDKIFPFVIQFFEYNAERKVYPVRIAFATGGKPLIADIALEGTSKLPIDFVITGEIPNLKKSVDWFNFNTMRLPKMNINIAGGIDRKKISLRKFNVAIDGSSINLSGTYDWSKSTPVINAKVSTDMINLYKSFPDWFGVGKTWVHPNRDLNCFQDMPLFGKYLYNVDANIDFDLKHFIVYRSLDLSNLKANIKVKNHVARVDAKLGIANGDMDLYLVSDIDKNGFLDVTMGAMGHNVYVGEILKQIYVNNVISGLPMDIDVFVKANGTNMSEIMQTITGPVMVYSTDRGFAHADLVEYMYGGDFLTTLRHNVEELFTGNKRNMIEIDGAVVNVKLRDGLIETKNGVAVETHVINMRLAGTLDLGKETINLSLASVPVRGLKLSLSGNLVNALEISGNLAEPDFKINGAAVVGKVGSAVGIGLLLSPFTGGLSIAGGLVAGLLAGDLLEGWLADNNPYDTAKEKGAPENSDDPEWVNEPVKILVSDFFNLNAKEK